MVNGDDFLSFGDCDDDRGENGTCLDLSYVDLDSLGPRKAEIHTGPLRLSLGSSSVIYDLETGPAKDVLSKIPPPPDETPFNPALIKTGDCKTAEKKAAKIEQRRQEHHEAWLAKVASWEQEHLEKAALNPSLGVVLAVCYHHEGGPVLHIADDEAELIRGVWSIHSTGVPMLGWNTHGFDLPFLLKRSWILGIPVPPGLFNVRRYWADNQIDMMKVWTIGEHGSGGYVRIGDAAQALGVGWKPGGAGKAFADAFRSEDRRSEAIDYLIDESCLHWGMAKKMRLV